MDNNAKKQLANWIHKSSEIREKSYNRDTDRYGKTHVTSMEEAGVPEDMQGVISACLYWYGDCESFIEKYK